MNSKIGKDWKKYGPSIKPALQCANHKKHNQFFLQFLTWPKELSQNSPKHSPSQNSSIKQCCWVIDRTLTLFLCITIIIPNSTGHCEIYWNSHCFNSIFHFWQSFGHLNQFPVSQGSPFGLLNVGLKHSLSQQDNP